MKKLAILVSTVALFVGACGEAPETVDTTETATAPATTAVTAAPTTTSVKETTTTTEKPSATSAPEMFTSGSFAVSFSIVKPDGFLMKRGTVGPEEYHLEHLSGKNEWIILTTKGASLEDWRNKDLPMAQSEEDTDVEVGGLPGSYFEFTAEGRFGLPGLSGFQIETGDVARLYVVEVDGQPVTIIGLAGPDLWAEFLPEFEGLLEGLNWD